MPRILVIDDWDLQRDIITSILRDEGYELQEADCQEAALDMASAEYDLFLVDIMLRPTSADLVNCDTMGGVSVIQRLRADEATSGVPIVAMTSRGDRDWVKRMLEPYNVQGYIEIRGITEEEILGIVRRALEDPPANT